MQYRYDAVALAPDPNLDIISSPLDFGSFESLANGSNGQRLVELLISRAAVIALFGAVGAAPSRPPVVAVEHLLAQEMGSVAFEDGMKRLAGRIVRQIIERLGGRWVRSGVPVTVPSRYNKASIYDFVQRPRRQRRPSGE